MKIASILLTVFPLTFLVSPARCEPEYVSNSRIFVEGTVTGNSVAGIPLKLSSGNIVISETNIKSDGTFKMGGPGTNSEKTLGFGRKIKSFISNEECKLSFDSTAIIINTGKSYIKFSQINIAP